MVWYQIKNVWISVCGSVCLMSVWCNAPGLHVFCKIIIRLVYFCVFHRALLGVVLSNWCSCALRTWRMWRFRIWEIAGFVQDCMIWARLLNTIALRATLPCRCNLVLGTLECSKIGVHKWYDTPSRHLIGVFGPALLFRQSEKLVCREIDIVQRADLWFYLEFYSPTGGSEFRQRKKTRYTCYWGFQLLVIGLSWGIYTMSWFQRLNQ